MEIASGMLVTQFTLFFVLSSNTVHSSMRALLSCYSSFTTQTVKHQHTLIKGVLEQLLAGFLFPNPKHSLFTPHTNPLFHCKIHLSPNSYILFSVCVLIVAEYRRASIRIKSKTTI